MAQVTLTRDIVNTTNVEQSVAAAQFGAVVTFAGNVRNNAQGREVLYLEYEGYAPLAQAELARIAEEAEERWNVRCAIAHRLGRVEIGECSVAVAVASAHRAEGFDACRWVMDTLKATVPIWKKEFFVGGACWIEGPHSVPSAS